MSSRSDVGDLQSPRRRRRSVPRQQLPETRGRRDKGVRGVVGDTSEAAASRAGNDSRKRGWYWHWNSIVTQYAPLIGLKGVGLLNSYTVWTDRREESPHRGYAFPTQQTESAFYGEDRAELITINKILVALDLIEIRKEMVLRTDEKGRKWRVPHNFYRVKDQGDGFTLTSDAVKRVVELADKDASVYRYVRRIFSPRFSPIDSSNVWHRILRDMEQLPVWQRLCERTLRTEQRASARSKAGHASRRSPEGEAAFSAPAHVDNEAPEGPPMASHNDTDKPRNDSTGATVETFAEQTNRGTTTTVDTGNTGFTEESRGNDDQINNGRATSVQPSNTTYYQELTTTTNDEHGERSLRPSLPESPAPHRVSSREQAFRQFEEANDRKPSRTEQRLLKMLAADLEEHADLSSDLTWSWIGDAIDEAVTAGSAFVAPRRIQEIVMRWSRDGRSESRQASPPQRTNKPVTEIDDMSHRFEQPSVTGNARLRQRAGQQRPVPGPRRRGDALRTPEFEIPDCALTNHQVWSGVVDELQRSGTMARVDIDAWVRMSTIVAVEGHSLVVGVPNVLAERRAANRYRVTLEQAVKSVTGIAYALTIVLGTGDDEQHESEQASGA